MSFLRARRRRDAKRSVPTYDWDDQFYQAFRAGWFHSRMKEGRYGNGIVPSEELLWSEYVAWLWETRTDG